MSEELEKASFEEYLAELEAIVGQLERGDLPLEESLELFERGVQLVTRCSKKLDEAEGKIQVLLEGEQGEPRLEPIDDEDGGR